MRRRRLLQWAAATLGLPRTQWAEQTFPGSQETKLKELAAVVLPTSLGPQTAQKFVAYVREYRPGAETEHGYGITYIRRKPGSPAAGYLKQLAELPSPVTADAAKRSIEAAGVKELPRVPDGKSVVADLMAFYFRSSDANDLCYQAAIGRDQCRGLQGSEKAPKSL